MTNLMQLPSVLGLGVFLFGYPTICMRHLIKYREELHTIVMRQ